MGGEELVEKEVWSVLGATGSQNFGLAGSFSTKKSEHTCPLVSRLSSRDGALGRQVGGLQSVRRGEERRSWPPEPKSDSRGGLRGVHHHSGRKQALPPQPPACSRPLPSGSQRPQDQQPPEAGNCASRVGPEPAHAGSPQPEPVSPSFTRCKLTEGEASEMQSKCRLLPRSVSS